MKLAVQKDDLVVSGAEEQGGFKIKATGKAFRILIDGLYSNKIQSIVRETSANAWDSHKEAKQVKPFFVHCPTAIRQEFYVRDYGVGMSHDKVMNLYSTLFESDKDGSNDLVGMFGLGSKSPFAYTDSFCVSCYDGQEVRHYGAAIGAGGVPQIILLSREACDEPTGVRVSFSAKIADKANFEKAIRIVALGFNPCFETNIELGNLWGTTCLEGSGWKAFKDSKLPDKWNVRQGCVVYPIGTVGGITLPYDYSASYLIDVPIGTIEVTSSRENVAYSEEVVKYLKQRIEEVKKEAPKLVARAVGDVYHVSDFFDKLRSIKPAWDESIYIHKPTGLEDTEVIVPAPACQMRVHYNSHTMRWNFDPRYRLDAQASTEDEKSVYLIEDISCFLDPVREDTTFSPREHRRIARILRNWVTSQGLTDARFWLAPGWSEDFVSRVFPQTKTTKLTTDELFNIIPKKKDTKPVETVIRGVALLKDGKDTQLPVIKIEGTADQCGWISAEQHRRMGSELRKYAKKYGITEIFVVSHHAYDKASASSVPYLWDALDAAVKAKNGVSLEAIKGLTEFTNDYYYTSFTKRLLTFEKRLRSKAPDFHKTFLRSKLPVVRYMRLIAPFGDLGILPFEYGDKTKEMLALLSTDGPVGRPVKVPDNITSMQELHAQLEGNKQSPAVKFLDNIGNAESKGQLIATAKALQAVFKLIPTNAKQNWKELYDYD